MDKKEENELDKSFDFPYSSDPLVKRQQIWSNLQKGLLFEDTQVLIPWLTPYSQLYKFEEKRQIIEDRTRWYLGHRTILDGYRGNFEVMKWVFVDTYKPIIEITESIGTDFEGMENFYYLKDYVTNLLGDPTKVELEKFGSLDIGSIEWYNGAVLIRLSGIEIFNCRYSFSIGHIRGESRKF
ncbi:MAG: hypothetical protein HYZ42_08020 [Bacteroidetes bacterium]|nr:hypothetical protein [Bacteroidota bacterium]